MFRIDVYHHQSKEKQAPPPPLYACLATAWDNGQLLRAGRKNATVLFESDKSVSRDHLHLHLMSNHKEHQEALVLNGDDDPVAAGAMEPQSQDEKDACDQNPRGMALLVKNLGKFGSAVVAMEPKAEEEEEKQGGNDNGAEKKASAGSDNETDAGGSDTEDESQDKTAAPIGKLPNISGVTWFDQTKKIVGSIPNMKIMPKKLDAKESFAVPGNASTILIQCGQVGSLLVLTRLDLNFCKSSISPQETSLWKKRLYAIGAALIEKNSDSFMLETTRNGTDASNSHQRQRQQHSQAPPPTTYMLTKSEREAASKQLVAWLLSIPFVTTGFLEAHLQRKEPSDPWPEMENFAPSNGSYDFWDAHYPLKSRFLESCTYLCTSNKQSDMECLVKAAGGHVVSLYDMKEKEAEKYVDELMEDSDKKDTLFTITAPGRSKLSKYLKSQGIAQLTPKEISASLCNQELPKDKDTGRVIGKLPVAETEQEGEPEMEKTVVPDGNVGEVSNSDKRKRDAGKETLPASENEGRNATSQNRKRDRESEVAIEEVPTATTKSSNKKPRQGKSQSQSQRSQRAQDTLSPVEEEREDDADPNNTTMASMEVEAENVEKHSKKRSRQEEKPDSKKRQIASRNQPQLKGSGTARLETTEDGWMITAPKDESRRKAYLKPREEMLESCSQEKPPDVAPTVACAGLICRRYDPNRNRVTGVRHKSSSGKDFKRFRKNPIKKVPRSSRIALRSVLPKETERQRQLEDQQRALEAQQRKADELFDGSGTRQSRVAKKPSTTRKRRNV